MDYAVGGYQCASTDKTRFALQVLTMLLTSVVNDWCTCRTMFAWCRADHKKNKNLQHAQSGYLFFLPYYWFWYMHVCSLSATLSSNSHVYKLCVCVCMMRTFGVMCACHGVCVCVCQCVLVCVFVCAWMYMCASTHMLKMCVCIWPCLCTYQCVCAHQCVSE